MKLTSVARGAIANIGVKLIALIVALVVWFNASGQQEVKRNYVASLSFVNLPDTLTMTGNVPEQVQINITGTRRELLFLRFRRLPMIVNLARATPGRTTQRTTVADVILPPGIEPGDIRIVSPLTLDLNVERLISKRLPVAVNLTGTLDPELLLNQAPVARPYWATVRGPESAVTPLERMQTESVDLSRIGESVTREVELAYDDALLECRPEKVTISIAVSPRATRVLANVPPTVLMDARNFQAEVSPKTVSLTIEGAKGDHRYIELR